MAVKKSKKNLDTIFLAKFIETGFLTTLFPKFLFHLNIKKILIFLENSRNKFFKIASKKIEEKNLKLFGLNNARNCSKRAEYIIITLSFLQKEKFSLYSS